MNFTYYLWLILLIIYILSPLDAHPLFFDDIIASGILFYLMYKNAKQKKQRQQYYSRFHSGDQTQEHKKNESGTRLSFKEACNILEVSPDATVDEVKKAYKEKIAKSHPDKVSHLSKELQDKAKELTLELNQAIDIFKHYKKT